MNAQLASIFPTLNTSLLIALTLSVSSASTERSFSKLRTTMSQTRLEDLLIIICERDIEPNIENSKNDNINLNKRFSDIRIFYVLVTLNNQLTSNKVVTTHQWRVTSVVNNKMYSHSHILST
ncbi:zinc finger MYM-type protein 1-like [Aphis craccivora]|uniref:Zinc finger MYM-type protein 1-like n=1 Tax=Aphis craccivora TaxID=307492 RepID=A0A6G0Y6C8_APHCR|nr:zinc finger MYM-type protein 1-like [Aphis craccivora]